MRASRLWIGLDVGQDGSEDRGRTNTLVITGVDELGGCDHTIESDYLEIGSFIGLAAVTRSPLVINKVQPDNLRMIRMVFDRLGVQTTIDGDQLIVPEDQTLQIKPDYHGHVPRIDDAIWPAFPTDLMSCHYRQLSARGLLSLRRCSKDDVLY